MRTEARVLRSLPLAVGLAVLVLGGCRQGMFDQEKKEVYEASTFFDDGASARPLPEHTIARGELREDRGYYLGTAADGTMLAELPMPVDRELLLRGRKMFEAYCSMCHDRAGTGNGMVVQRGYPRPTSYHEPRLRAMPVGYFVNVITAGFGRMPSYATQVPPEDRWAIAAYIKVLQASQATSVAELDPAVRERLERERVEAAARAAAEEAGHGAHGEPHGRFDGEGAPGADVGPGTDRGPGADAPPGTGQVVEP